MTSNFAVICENPLPTCDIDAVAAAREHLRRAREHLSCAYLLTGGEVDIERSLESCDNVYDKCTLSLLEQRVPQPELAMTCARAYEESCKEYLCL